MNRVRIEKTKRHSVPYTVIVNDLIVALCPSEFTANLVSNAIAFKLETIINSYEYTGTNPDLLKEEK